MRYKEIEALAINMEKKTASLEIRIQTLEVDLEQLRNENKSLRAQFKAPEIDSEVEIESEETLEALEVCEENFVEKNKCNKCDFIGKNGAGLKIHDTAKNKENPPFNTTPSCKDSQK